MVRTWGHSNRAFATFCVLTNALDVATKLVLPVVAVIGLALRAGHVPTALWVVASTCLAVLVLVRLLQAVVLRSGRLHSLAPLRQTMLHTRRLLLDHWSRLVPASLVYVAAQVFLLEFSLRTSWPSGSRSP